MVQERNKRAVFRFYEELNDFLPPEKKKRDIDFLFTIAPSVKDAIESMGIPHTEIDLIIANGESVDFDYKISDDDIISVYPVFESLDISPLKHLISPPLREVKFVSDVHLGKLSRYLRLCGFDVFYENNLDDREIIEISVSDRRAILTRDREMLKNNLVTHGYWLRNTDSLFQLSEIYERFDLYRKTAPLSRCTRCNCSPLLRENVDCVRPLLISHGIKPESIEYYDEYLVCPDCKQIYWKGSHIQRFMTLLREKAPRVAEYFRFQ